MWAASPQSEISRQGEMELSWRRAMQRIRYSSRPIPAVPFGADGVFMMPSLPRAILEIFAPARGTNPPGLAALASRRIGTLDITEALARRGATSPGKVQAWIDGRETLLVCVLSTPICDPDIRAAVLAGAAAAVPGGREVVAAWVQAIGGLDRVPDAHQHVLDVRRAEGDISDAEGVLADLMAATWSGKATSKLVFDPDEMEDFRSTIEDLRARPGHRGFCFARTHHRWEGMSVSSIREHHAAIAGDNAARTSDAFRYVLHCTEEAIHEDLEGLYENAERDVVGLRDLSDLLAAWMPHAGTGSPEDLALEAAVGAWNARQTITTYLPDITVAFPVVPGVTHEEMISREAARIEGMRASLQQFKASGWSPDAAAGPIPR